MNTRQMLRNDIVLTVTLQYNLDLGCRRYLARPSWPLEYQVRNPMSNLDEFALPCSRSALGNTMFGDFPPNSRVTFLRLDAAAAAIILRPVTVDPVNAI
jgi:hypothetical protein